MVLLLAKLFTFAAENRSLCGGNEFDFLSLL